MVEAGVTDFAKCVETMEETLILLADGDYRVVGAPVNSDGAQINFPDNSIHEGMPANGSDRHFIAMPAYLGSRFNGAGVKWYSSNADNRQNDLPGSIHLFILTDAITGVPKAVMSANLLSAYHTGAVPGVGVKHLADEDTEVVGIIGPGVMSRTILGPAMSQRPSIRKVKVKGRSQASTQEAPGRQNDEEIFCYSIGGMPVEDVAFATDIYDNAGKGQQHLTVPVSEFDEDSAYEGLAFDGSSVAGYTSADNSDMMLLPDLDTGTT